MNAAQEHLLLETLKEIKNILEQMNKNSGDIQNDVHYIKIDLAALVEKLIKK